MEIVKNTRRVPSKSIFESLADNFNVQSNRYRRSWPASSKFQINIYVFYKKERNPKEKKKEEMTYILNLTGALEKDNAGAFI